MATIDIWALVGVLAVDAQNMIKALQKAIALGWFNK